jgi:hypothetical protein
LAFAVKAGKSGLIALLGESREIWVITVLG